MGMRIGSTRTLQNVTCADVLELSHQVGVSESIIRNTSIEIAEGVLPAFKEACLHLEEMGFEDAPYLIAELEEEFFPRIETLRQVR